jgi:prepilin-type N-terminal cleavage/methylation domain-containing protein
MALYGAVEYRQPRSFTLIELLIVVAIIGVLAAIAVPNFLNARVRSQVARVVGDMQALDVALSSYFADHGKFPPDHWARIPQLGRDPRSLFVDWCHYLTTPIAYMASVNLPDPFFIRRESAFLAGQGGQTTGWETSSYHYFNYGYGHVDELNSLGANVTPSPGCRLQSFGPSKTDLPRGPYHPSNGLMSEGDIVRDIGVTPPQVSRRVPGW